MRKISPFGFTAYGHSYPSASEEALKEKHANLTGKAVDGSYRGKGLSNDCLTSGNAHQATGNNREIEPSIVNANSMPAQRGMVLPFVPLSLTFDNIQYSIDTPQVSLYVMNAQKVRNDVMNAQKVRNVVLPLFIITHNIDATGNESTSTGRSVGAPKGSQWVF